MDLTKLREAYTHTGLNEADLDADPLVQFRLWMQQAIVAGLREPNAMTLATVSTNGAPSARMVLLKELDEDGFVFYTNYLSQKARELDGNPRACLLFFWNELARQVRIDGIAARVTHEESEEYFQTRPYGSQLGAWTSPQSSVIPGRVWLESEAQRYAQLYAEGTVPRPQHWGGYRVVPDAVEFWQGRPNRLHDRLRYRRDGSAWIIERLAP